VISWSGTWRYTLDIPHTTECSQLTLSIVGVLVVSSTSADPLENINTVQDILFLIGASCCAIS
jgi:hypothetical protein